MVGLALFGLIGLTWLGFGLAMIAVPSRLAGWLQRSFSYPLYRFLLTQAILLGGLILVLGSTELPSHILWIALGVIAVLKGMFLLGAPDKLFVRLLGWWQRMPHWALRLAGLVLVTLSTLLAVDTIHVLS